VRVMSEHRKRALRWFMSHSQSQTAPLSANPPPSTNSHPIG
jgi:hypothetical protein